MNDETSFLNFLSNQWSKCHILRIPMDTVWVQQIGDRSWKLVNNNNEEEIVGRLDKIWKDYEHRYNAYRAGRERGGGYS